MKYYLAVFDNCTDIVDDDGKPVKQFNKRFSALNNADAVFIAGMMADNWQVTVKSIAECTQRDYEIERNRRLLSKGRHSEAAKRYFAATQRLLAAA